MPQSNPMRLSAALAVLTLAAADDDATTSAAPSVAPTTSLAPTTSEWWRGGYIGQECEPGQGAGVCPPGQSCYAPSDLYLSELNDEEEDDETGQYRCACWAYYGYEGHDNKEGTCMPGPASNIIGGAYALATIWAVWTAGFFWLTLGIIIKNWGKKRLKLNAAITTLILGTMGSTPMVFVTQGFMNASFFWDKEITFEREGQKGIGIGLMALFGLPCILNVVNLWVDVALGAMSKGGTKKQRAATKRKIERAIYTVTAISSIFIAALLVLDMVAYVLSFLVFMAVCVGITYAIGGRMLGKALSLGHEGEGKKGCCAGPSVNKEDMNVYMVLQCSNGIVRSMAGAVLGTLGYLAFPSQPSSDTHPPNFFPPVGICITLMCFTAAFFNTLLYIRYGLRKALDVEFPDAPKNSTNTTQTTVTTTSDAQVAPSEP